LVDVFALDAAVDALYLADANYLPVFAEELNVFTKLIYRIDLNAKTDFEYAADVSHKFGTGMHKSRLEARQFL
jgi:hypothetical protein